VLDRRQVAEEKMHFGGTYLSREQRISLAKGESKVKPSILAQASDDYE
jgi:hypothetical protein